jgi:hypothetical protein
LDKLELLHAKQRKLELLRKRAELVEKYPHLYAQKHFIWSRKFHDSTNRVNLLCAANQIGKSTAAIRRHIDNATDPTRWARLWKTEPKMFWYFYPDSSTLEREWNTKWRPLMPDDTDEDYGWKVHYERGGVPKSIEWNSGVFTYFMFYSKAASAMQAGTVHDVTCFPKGVRVSTPTGSSDVSEIKEGDEVLSHGGIQKVYDLQSREADLYSVKFTNAELRCTGEHPFYTERGWVEAKELTAGDAVYKSSPWIKILTLLMKILSTPISFCLTACSTKEKMDTRIVAPQTTGAVETVKHYMLLCGKSFTAKKFLSALLYTIKISIHLITTFPILCVLLAANIIRYIKKMSGSCAESTREHVTGVLRLLLHDLLKTQFVFVQDNAVKPSKESVLYVIKNILLEKIQIKQFVQDSALLKEKEIVYNFAVTNSHTFFANEILTHNCDEELPLELWDELSLRLARTHGIMNCVFTPTLNQPFWQKAIETNEVLKDALKLQVSMYDCLEYEDGSPNTTMTEADIQEVIRKCSSETEVLRRVFGKFVTEVGRTFFAFNFDKNLKPLINYEKMQVYASVDYGSGGSSGHPAAIVFIATTPDFKSGQVIRAWRGDGIQTTAGDVYDKYREMSKDLKVVQACYDPAAADFGTIAIRNGSAFSKANKARDDGEKIVNTLFRYDMLSLAEDDGEIAKLGAELSHIMDTNNRTKSSKKHDDLADALRYLCMLIPWNFVGLSEKFEEKVVIETRPLTEAEYQIQQIKDRRGEFEDTKDEWQDFENEFSHWNEEYGN